MAVKTKKLDVRTRNRVKKLNSRFWRLNHLYWIMDDSGNRILFKMNAVQKILYFAMWWLNVIPKSRQHGITTLIALFMLDACIFNPNMRCGIIAHKLEDAKKIFRDKIKYAFNSLPADLKKAREPEKKDTTEILFNNNSSIYVSTSMRSGTLQILHVSEYGWLCAHAPAKAQEIKTGAMETVHEGSMIFVEATSEGPYGDFFDMCEEANEKEMMGKELGPMDYKKHFFPWWMKKENRTDPKFVDIPKALEDYFGKVERIGQTNLDIEQRAWYAMKKKRLKHDIYKEHPSTYEEIAIASVEGAYFAEEMAEMRESGRITNVPHLPDRQVYTVCDLGLGSAMPWIFFQVVGLEVHIIDSFCLDKKDDPLKGMAFYKHMLNEKQREYGYLYGKHFCPFDINKGEIGAGKTIYEQAESAGLHFEKLEREKSVLDGIQRMRTKLVEIWIDGKKNPELIKHWSNYHREWIEGMGRYDFNPAHDQSSHYADAGRYLSEVLKKKLYQDEEPGITKEQIAKWSRENRRMA